MSYIGGNTNPGNYIGNHPVAGLASSLPSLRNLLINGSAQISQRGDVTGVSSTTYGGPDRFQHIMGSAGTFSISQSTDAPDGFSNSIKVACTSSTSLSTGNLYLLGQKIEGQNVQHLEYGSSTAKSLTFSFWVKTNVSGDYAVEFFSQTANRQISKSFNISSAEASAFSWVKRTMTIPGDTVTAVPNNNTAELVFYIWLCAGTDYTSGTLNSSAWASNTNANRALPMNLGSSTSNEFYITGVQLEEGTVATPFEHRPISVELGLCQRYYEKSFNLSTAPANNTSETTVVYSHLQSGYGFVVPIVFKERKRAAGASTIVYNPYSTTANRAAWVASANEAFTYSNVGGITETGFYVKNFSSPLAAPDTTGNIIAFNWSAESEL